VKTNLSPTNSDDPNIGNSGDVVSSGKQRLPRITYQVVESGSDEAEQQMNRAFDVLFGVISSQQ